jgi:alkylation response protein AidB-like acyl-CoA dehydrogenase
MDLPSRLTRADPRRRRALCARFGDAYWRSLEPDGYPSEFVAALTEAGWLAALIPERHGGSGLPLATARAILEEICAAGPPCTSSGSSARRACTRRRPSTTILVQAFVGQHVLGLPRSY